jgi:hypothetical protein
VRAEVKEVVMLLKRISVRLGRRGIMEGGEIKLEIGPLYVASPGCADSFFVCRKDIGDSPFNIFLHSLRWPSSHWAANLLFSGWKSEYHFRCDSTWRWESTSGKIYMDSEYLYTNQSTVPLKKVWLQGHSMPHYFSWIWTV